MTTNRQKKRAERQRLKEARAWSRQEAERKKDWDRRRAAPPLTAQQQIAKLEEALEKPRRSHIVDFSAAAALIALAVTQAEKPGKT